MSETKIKSSEEAVRAANPTLGKRGKIYGDYHDGVTIRHNLMSVLKKGYKKQHDHEMSPTYEEYFWDICNKLSRLSVCPQHLDSWNDVAGYAQLIQNTLKESGEGVE